ncbi:class I SAM-dependent methyltransferase [Solidesulfovibrio sp.]|uniref:methyltransferase n=1 Tax=Solidesulfovibrio sp. TaxID=2910990 RepID=UPI00260C546F|nr:class I SAM-dependent methyltransferase [Solidesulfovibrio sp.]
MNKSDFDKFAKNYNSILSNSIHFSAEENLYFAEYKVVLTASLVDTSSVNNVLDFGCGTGRSLVFLRKYFPKSKIVGYDPSQQSLQIAAKNNPGCLFSSDWNALRGKTFDLIFAANVFHHIPSDFQHTILCQCNGILDKRGSFFIFEHNPFNPATRWVFEQCPFDKNAEMISKGKMKKTAASAGLREIDEGYTLFFPCRLSFLRSIEVFLKKLPLGAQYYVRLKHND